MTTSRWEKERAGYLVGHTRPGSSGRRRAELIGRRARRMGRGGTGVAETTLREDVTEPLFMRMLKTDEGSKEQLSRLVMVPALFVIVGLLIGPAMLIAAVAYGLMWYWSPRIGRLWDWPWYLAAAVVAFGGALLVDLSWPFELESWPIGVRIYVWSFLQASIWVQLTLGLILTGEQIRWSGWKAVKPGSAPKREKDKHGQFIKTPDHKKVRLDPLAGVEVPQRPSDEAAPNPHKKVKLADFTAESMAATPEATPGEPEPDEDEPVFANEDDDEFDLDDFEEKEKGND